MIARCVGLVVLLASVLMGGPALSAKLALVIGNDAYQNVPRLERAVGDAQAIGATLQQLGYAVTVSSDLTYKGMAHALAEFSARIQPGDTAVLQFSGHGVAIDGRNYLLPVDVEEPGTGDAAAIEALSFDAGKITEQLTHNKPKLVFVILDACRNNPFETKSRSVGSGRGLARMDVEPGEFILFSAGPGEEALDRLGESDHEKTSVFTRVLLKSMSVPGITLQKLAKATQGGVSRLAASIQHEQFPDYFDRTIDEPVLSSAGEAAAPPQASGECASPLLGRWVNADPKSRSLDHLVISAVCTGGQLRFAVEIFGRCTPSPCPWGVRPALAHGAGDDLTGRFDFSFAIKDVSLSLGPDRHLAVVTATRYIDKSGRNPRTSTDSMVRDPAALP
ncbi:caspase family protein [Labrys neptuniae]